MITLEVEQYEIGLGIMGKRPKWTVENPEPKRWTAGYDRDNTAAYVTVIEQ